MTEPQIKFAIKCPLLGNCAAVELAIASIDDKTNAIVARDHRFKRKPPQFAQTIRKAGGHVNGKRHSRFLKNGVGPLQRVTITIVENKADETPREISVDHAAVHLVEANQIQS